MLSIIDSKNIKPEVTDNTREYTWLDTKYIKLPDVTGMDLKSAKALLKGFSIEYSGTGDKVIEQSPLGDRFVKEGSTIKLLLQE